VTRTDRLAVALAALLGGVVVTSGATPARAEVVFTVQPTLSVGYSSNPGVTTNAAGTSSQSGDGLVILSSSERLLYRGAIAEYEVGYRLALTRYMRGRGVDNTSHELAASSLFHLTSAVDLRLFATGSLSRTSAVITAVAPASMPQASVPGSTQFVSVSAGEEVTIAPTPRWRFVQSLNGSTVNYINVPIDPPTRTSVTALGRIEHPVGLDTPLLELQATDFVLTGGPPGTVPPTPDQSLFLMGLAGWRREINPVWSTELRGGLTTLIRSTASTVYIPSGSAQIAYRRLTWNATLTASQEPLPNLFSGQPTINDSVIAHVMLPIGRTEQVVLTGAGAYVYARVADDAGNLHHVYDQWTLLSLLSYRFLNAPLFVSLSYSLVDQTGGMTDLRRQIVMLNLTGVFMWGPGTPPLFGGGGL
jgi:hypothetical protein